MNVLVRSVALSTVLISSIAMSAEEEVVEPVVTEPGIVGTIVTAFEMVAVYIMVVGIIAATLYFVWELIKKPSFNVVFMHYREHMAQAILLGVEVLVVGNVINTVVVDATTHNFMMLCVLIIVRTFLSLSTSVEAHGFWPWERKKIALQKKSEIEVDRDRR